MFVLSQPAYDSTTTSTALSPWLQLESGEDATPEPSSGARVVRSEAGATWTIALPQNRTSNIPIASGDNTYTIAISPSVENISSVTIGDRLFSPATNSDLQDGEYYYNSATNTLTINSTAAIAERAFYQAHSDIVKYKSTAICDLPYDPFLAQWNATSISIERSFGGHPRAAIAFVACLDRENEIRSQLCGGTEVTALGSKWICDGEPSIKKFFRDNRLEVNLNLTGVHSPATPITRSPLDTPVRKKIKVGNKLQKTVKLGFLLGKVGVNYLGKDINIRIPKSTPSTDSFNVRSELESRAVTAKGFVYYSNPNAVEVRNWGKTKIHVINESDLRSEFIEYSRPGWGAKVDGVKLVEEWRNRRLILDFDKESKSEGLAVTWEFENASNLFEVQSSAQSKGFFLEQPSIDYFRKPSSAYDGGGYTKTAIERTTYNGSPIKIVTEVYGFIFTSKDIYEVQGANNNQIVLKTSVSPQNLWQKVKSTTETYLYNTDGYLIQVISTGWELARNKQETEALEAISLQAQAQQAGLSTPEGAAFLNKILDYEFNVTLPINDITEHGLVKLEDYYEDIEPADPCDEGFIDPKFCDRTNRDRVDYFVVPGETTDDDSIEPPTVKGKWYKETERKVVTATGRYERFIIKRSATNQENDAGRDAIAISSSTENTGRPGIHSRIEKELDFSQVEENANYQLYKNKKYYLNSTGFSTDACPIPEGSEQYPDIDDPDLAFAIAQTKFSIANTRAETFSLNIHWRSGIEEGDLALFEGKLYVIFAISDRRELQRDGVWNSSEFSLKLGKLIDSNLTFFVN